MERGKIKISEKIASAGSGDIIIKITAPGGHIAESYRLPNVNTIMSIITAEIVKRFKLHEPSEKPPEVFITSASTELDPKASYNIIGEWAESRFVYRIMSEKYKEYLSNAMEAIKEIVEKETKEWKSSLEKYMPHKAGDFKISVDLVPGYRPIIHRSPELVDLVKNTLSEVADKVEVVTEKEPGSEDFSFYLEEYGKKQIPGVFFTIGASNPKKGIHPTSTHSSSMLVDEDTVKDVAKFQTLIALKALNHFKTKE